MLFKRTLSKQLKTRLNEYLAKTYLPSADALVFEDDIADKEASLPREKGRKTPAKMCGAVMRESAPMYESPAPTAVPDDLGQRLMMLDETFQQMLLRKIDEKGLKDSACYKRAGADRKLFSKIRSNPQYKPKKSTAIAFCIALELPLEEARELLMKAGYALSHSSKADVIVEYFILNRRYDLNELNIALYEYDQALI